MDKVKLYNGDCLEVMDRLIEEGVKVDAIITDPPYGTTKCKWDSVIPFEEMWERLRRLRNDNTPIVLFGTEPFSSLLRTSNLKEYKYDWIWQKSRTVGFANCKKMPLKNIEKICLFYKNPPTYNPQGVIKVDKVVRNSKAKIKNDLHQSGQNGGSMKKESYIQEFTNYPKQIIEFSSEYKTQHPTQKPVALMEYLIKTYTNEGDVVLDFTMGSGTTGVACVNTNRKFIGIELDKSYFNITKERIECAVDELSNREENKDGE